jgi:hypothetical protein
MLNNEKMAAVIQATIAKYSIGVVAEVSMFMSVTNTINEHIEKLTPDALEKFSTAIETVRDVMLNAMSDDARKCLNEIDTYLRKVSGVDTLPS